MDFYDVELRAHHEHLRAAWGIGPGDEVLDIGCGTGLTTREAARAAAPGRVVGVDVSERMLERARQLTATERLDNVRYELGDAEVHRFEPESFDVAISRFGTMFFADPAAAFANIGAALRHEGRLVLLVWQRREHNEWTRAIDAALGDAAQPPPPGADPFSLGDAEATAGLLEGAGFEDVRFEDVHEPVLYGHDIDAALAFIRGFQCTSAALASLSADDAARAVERLRELLAAHYDEERGVVLDARSWLITARRSGRREFAAIAERHRRELHVHCYRMLGSFDDAEDVVQEALLRAWRARATLERPENLRAWLYRIATNACLDAIRRRDRSIDSYESIADVTWLQPYPDNLLDAAVERETIELTFLAVIQLLPPPQRATLILREMLGWSAKETAELLELSVTAVNSALQRARATLREQLPPEGRELWTSPEASEDERRALEGFIDAHQRGDTEAALALIADDVRVTMPPQGYLFDGRAAVVPLIERAHSGVDGEWRLVPTAANRQPAAASYLRAPGDDTFRAFKLDVMRIADGKIAEVTTFGSDRFEAFGLPMTFPPPVV